LGDKGSPACATGALQDGRGLKHIALVLTEAGWRIVSVVWEDDTWQGLPFVPIFQ
jgi:hypothetical protein